PGNRQVFFRAPVTSANAAASGEPFVGTYRTFDKLMMVSLEGDRLVVSTPGQPPFALVRTSATEFYLKRLPGYAVEFKTGSTGAVSAAVVTLPNEVVVLEKLDRASPEG